MIPDDVEQADVGERDAVAFRDLRRLSAIGHVQVDLLRLAADEAHRQRPPHVAVTEA